MSRSARFLLLLVVGLAALTFGASVVVERQNSAWVEKDLNLRARLAVNGARSELVASWRSDPARLWTVLSDLAADERIMGACACSLDGMTMARTDDYPDELPCELLVARAQREGPNVDYGHWTTSVPLSGGDVHVAALPIADEQGELGYMMLVHDLSFVGRREARMRVFLVSAFGFLAVMASLVTLVASRMSWRDWSDELRGILRGGRGERKEFQPILSDVRELVDRMMEQEGRPWTPQRLKDTLRHLLRGEKVIVLANREPYVHQRVNGVIQVMHPASGLVTALEPILRVCSGTWIAHASGSADKETADRRGRLRVPPGEEAYTLRRLWLTAEEERGYYFGFANEGLWPLCHIAHTRPTFRAGDWEQYRRVNEKFVR